MDPTVTPPWRVLDTTPPDDGSSGPPAPPTSARPTVTAPLLRSVAVGGAALACAALAIVLATGSGRDGGVLIDGPGTADAGVGSSGDPASPTVIVVEATGAVAHPGVFRLAVGSRVADLVAAAGGYGPRVDTERLAHEVDLVASLHDGDRIRVPSRDDAATVRNAPSSSAAAALDLNRATAAELEALPGIGPVTAQKILTAREEARFTSVDDLRTRGVLGEKTFGRIRDLVAVP